MDAKSLFFEALDNDNISIEQISLDILNTNDVKYICLFAEKFDNIDRCITYYRIYHYYNTYSKKITFDKRIILLSNISL